MNTTRPPRRLSEQDIAQLYMQTEAPLRLDALLQGEVSGDSAQIAVHDSIGSQTPDLALISLSLCGLVVARDFPDALKNGPFGPVAGELAAAAEDNLLRVGRLWLDSANGIDPDPKADKETILSIPDRLRILTSIFMELRDALDDGPETLAHAVKTLYYQAESHADLADRFVERLTRPARAKSGAKKTTPDQIPLPFDLTRPRTGADVVAFSLFRPRKNPS